MGSMLGRPTACAAWVFCGIAVSSAARADERNPAVAEALFRDAQQLLAAGKTADACAKFSESQRLDPQTGTLLNLALCHDKQGRVATAWTEYGEVVTQAARKGERARESFARTHAAEAEKRLAYVKLDVPPGTRTIEVDAAPLGEAAWTVPLPLDPGEHAFTFVAPGKKPRALRAVVPQGPSTTHVTPPAFEDEPAGGASPAGSGAATSGGGAPGSVPAHDEVPGGEPPPSSSNRTVGWMIVGGIGAAAVVTGGVFGGLALGKKSVVDAHCQGRDCDATGFGAQDSAHTFATVSTVAFVAAAVELAVGSYFVLTSGKSDPKASSLRVGTVATGGGALLRLEGGF
jgi:hypothetical protein